MTKTFVKLAFAAMIIASGTLLAEEPVKAPDAGTAPKPTVTNPSVEKTGDAAKSDAGKTKEVAEKKTEVKKPDNKKPAAVANTAPDASESDLPSAPQQHLSYAQLQQMLKQGRSAMCLCPRCDTGGKNIGAKLAE